MIAQGTGYKQIAARVKRKHVDEMYRMLATEKMSFNKFIEIVAESYIKSDPRIRSIIEEFRRNDAVPQKETKKRFSFSDEEKDDLFREIGQETPLLDDE